jgi:uncharacterized protein (DUF1778 family)
MSTNRTSRKSLQGWVSPRDHRIILAAAGLKGMTVGEFVASATLDTANQLLPATTIKVIDAELKKENSK